MVNAEVKVKPLTANSQCLQSVSLAQFALEVNGTTTNKSLELKTHNVNSSPATDCCTLLHNRQSQSVSRMGEFEMTTLHKKVLRLNRTFLLENLFLCEVFYSELSVNDLLTDKMLEEIQVCGSTEYYRFLHYRFCATCSSCNSLVICQRHQLFFHQISLPTLTRIAQIKSNLIL